MQRPRDGPPPPQGRRSRLSATYPGAFVRPRARPRTRLRRTSVDAARCPPQAAAITIAGFGAVSRRRPEREEWRRAQSHSSAWLAFVGVASSAADGRRSRHRCAIGRRHRLSAAAARTRPCPTVARSSSPRMACARTSSRGTSRTAMLPALGNLMRTGSQASGNGLLTQATPNTGAGWYSLATGAWPGHARLDQQHLPCQRPAVREPDRGIRSGRAPGRVDRPGGSARRPQGRPGRMGRRPQREHPGSHDRLPLVLLRSGRRNELRRSARRRSVRPQLRPPVRPSGGLRRAVTRMRRRRRSRRPAGSACPCRTARRWSCACASSTARTTSTACSRTSTTRRTTVLVNYDRVLLAPVKDGSAAVGDLRAGEWADIKVRIVGGSLGGRTAGMLVKVETLAPDLSKVRLYHSSVARAIATWPTWPGEPGFTSFEEFLAVRFPTSMAADFAVLEAGIVSEETYVEQGLYWETGHHPILRYIAATVPARPAARRLPDDRRVPAPVPRAGLADAAERPGEPGVRRRPGGPRQGQPRQPARGLPDARVRGRRRHAGACPVADGHQPDDVRRVGPWLRAAVPRDRRVGGPRRPRPALAAADEQLPPGDRRDDRRRQGLLGRRHRPDLPQPRRPRSRWRRLHADRRDRRGGDGHRGSRRRSRPSRTRTIGPATPSPRTGTRSTGSTRRPRRGRSRTVRTAGPTWRTRRAPAT